MQIEMMTVKEVADELRISVPSVYTMIAKGDLHSVTVGKKIIRVKRSQLNEYINSATNAAGGQDEVS